MDELFQNDSEYIQDSGLRVPLAEVIKKNGSSIMFLIAPGADCTVGDIDISFANVVGTGTLHLTCKSGDTTRTFLIRIHDVAKVLYDYMQQKETS